MEFLNGPVHMFLMLTGFIFIVFFKKFFKKQPVETGCANDYKRLVLYQTYFILTTLKLSKAP